MSFQKLANAFGVMILAGAFLWSAGVVLSRSPVGRSEKVQIRFAHWNLESGLREAFDAVAQEYMRIHPNVEIMQVPVPGRVYQTWTQTGFAGGTIPDLLVLGRADDELLTNHFLPLSEEVSKPNPYNAGTPLEKVPWRDTFLDGLSKSFGVDSLLETYSIPIAAVTVRMYYNVPLWKQILGDTPPPKTFSEFLEICRRVQAFAKSHQDAIAPVSGSRFTGEMLLGRLFQSQTQKLALRIDRGDTLAFPKSPTASAFAPGFGTLDDPDIRDGYAIMREVGQFMQPGFLELDRDDAILRFGQGRALMIPTGVWDFGSIVEQSAFDIGVFEIPLPDSKDPVFGKNSLGPVSEAGAGLAVNFLLSSASRHPEVATDFLKFLTSQPGNAIFSSVSKWPPGIVGVEMPQETLAFDPRVEGATSGISVAPMMYGVGDLYRVQAQNLHLLFGSAGSVEQLLEGMRPEFDMAVRSDLERFVKTMDDSSRALDARIGAWEFLKRDGDPAAVARASGFWQAQNAQESRAVWIRSALAGKEVRP